MMEVNAISNQEPTVVIILATYNGEKYIEEQIRSIQEQGYQSWCLLIRDDCSTDGTVQLIKRMAVNDKRISLLNHDDSNIGVVKSFGLLMEEALKDENTEYVFFSDQDDVWSSKKLEVMLQRFSEIEKLSRVENEAILIHSDLEVVDATLSTINESFMSYQAIRHESVAAWQVLAVQNFVTGCSMAINRSLLEQAQPLPTTTIMHDWWIALFASIYGHIEFIDETLLKYRQHESNEVGAKGFWGYINPFSQNLLSRWKNGAKHFNLALGQVNELLNRGIHFQKEMDNEVIGELKVVANILRLPRLKRFILLPKIHIRRQNKLTNILLFFRIILS